MFARSGRRLYQTALDGGRAMGLTSGEMLAAMSHWTRRDFYKSNDGPMPIIVCGRTVSRGDAGSKGG